MFCVASEAAEESRAAIINIVMYVAGALCFLSLLVLVIFIISLRVRLTGERILTLSTPISVKL